jgi:hypothetical protein
MICNPYKVLLEQWNKDEVGKASGMYGGGESDA